ncbi:MAG: hypothetical protein P8104_00185 [Gammaproteobacteria bacterium]
MSRLLFSGAQLLSALIVCFASSAYAADGATLLAAKYKQCPDRWAPSSAPGGCSPTFFTLELAGLKETLRCPSGWVESSVPGGCSPEFFTLRLNGVRDSIRSCPDGWVRSSAPGGCSPGYITLKQAGLRAINSCADGWVRSSAPGGCSPDNFTLETGFDGIDRASFHCVFGAACDTMIESIKALGGTCNSNGPDTTCDLPPLIDEDN